MTDTRGELEVESLLKIVLVLIALLLVLQLIQGVIGSVATLLGPFFIVVQLAIAALIVLWLLDRI